MGRYDTIWYDMMSLVCGKRQCVSRAINQSINRSEDIKANGNATAVWNTWTCPRSYNWRHNMYINSTGTWWPFVVPTDARTQFSYTAVYSVQVFFCFNREDLPPCDQTYWIISTGTRYQVQFSITVVVQQYEYTFTAVCHCTVSLYI